MSKFRATDLPSIPKTMNAFVLHGHGDLDKLVFEQNWPVPKIENDEVLIKVEACGLNNTDVNTRSGWYSKSVSEATNGNTYDEVGDEDPAWGGSPISFPRIQGADGVGTIVAVGNDVPDGMIGKRVIIDCWLRDWNDPLNKNSTGYFGSECDGGFAEFTKTHYKNAVPIESDLSSAELATFSCSYSTAEGMLNRANVGSSDIVLIAGASGGVGSALVQLAKRRGAKIVALASPQKHEAVKALGADFTLARSPEDLSSELENTIGSSTVSVVADIVGGEYFSSLIDVLERGGRYTCSGAIGGPIVDLDLRTLYLRDLTFTGSTVLPPETFGDLVKYIENGEIKPALAATYPLKELHKAQTAFIEKKHTGNIVVTM